MIRDEGTSPQDEGISLHPLLSHIPSSQRDIPTSRFENLKNKSINKGGYAIDIFWISDLAFQEDSVSCQFHAWENIQCQIPFETGPATHNLIGLL